MDIPDELMRRVIALADTEQCSVASLLTRFVAQGLMQASIEAIYARQEAVTTSARQGGGF